DRKSLELVLELAHAQFKRIPAKLSYEGLVQLASVCLDYDTTGLVVPFLDAWIKPYRDHITRPGYEQWLLVAYAFGFIDDFENISNRLVLSCTSKDGKCLDSNGSALTGR
ncbi:uncharacterized protein BDZ99DRAFT_359070, partial [Mytilinidion resinicola]